ncbi:MAG: transketolase family protein [Oscillospiraceae bacterium]|nr:transketolase family protein [Oscillospiraceae bacterium]
MTDYLKAMPQRTAFGLALCDIAQENERLVVLDADVAPSTQTHLFQQAFPARFFQCGIAEQNMVGIAAGLSTQGFVPFVSAFAVFLAHRAGDQIRNAIAHPRANVKLNGSYAGLPTGRAGATHSCVEDLAVMRSLPGMTIFDPADALETMLFTRLAVEMEGPVYLRTVRCDVPPVFGEGHRVALGKAVHVRDGGDVTLISTGMMTARALEAADLLERRGIHAGLLHMPTLKPIDREAILTAAAKTPLLVTVENHSIIGGLGSAVCEVTAEDLPCRVARCGYRDIFLESGDDEVLFDRYGLSAGAIAGRVEKALIT